MNEVERLRKNVFDNLQEIERLNKENKLLQDMDKILKNENTNLKLEIKRLNSIIKEVREYIGLDEELRKLCINYDVNGIGILEILDKVSK